MTDTQFPKIASSLNFLATIIGLSLITPLVVIGMTIGISLIIPNFSLDSTFLTIFFVITCTLYNLFLMFIVNMGDPVDDGDDMGHYFSILVPANNEENVINETLKRILEMDYPSELFEVIVVNDGSQDHTEVIVKSLQQKYPNLKLINVPPNKGCKGKSSALNRAFADFLLTWRGIEIRPRHRWIIGVFDADAKPDRNMLKKVSFQFNNPKIGGVQTLVRIKNRNTSLLAKMQDIEFITFSRVVQFARNMYRGSVALGGNGQFIRAIALDTVALKDQEEYWKEDALTEDLDMGIRLITKKWENRYIDSCCVEQEGVETLKAMFHQRERWAWGHIQTLVRYVLSTKVWTAKIQWRTKIDVMFYLFYVLIPSLVVVCWVWSGLSVLGVIPMYNMFPLAFTLANSFSFFPLLGYGLWKERNEYPLRNMIPLLLVTTVYTYHWIPCTTSAIVKVIFKRPNWKKTPRFDKKRISAKISEPLSKKAKYQTIPES